HKALPDGEVERIAAIPAPAPVLIDPFPGRNRAMVAADLESRLLAESGLSRGIANRILSDFPPELIEVAVAGFLESVMEPDSPVVAEAFEKRPTLFDSAGAIERLVRVELARLPGCDAC